MASGDEYAMNKHRSPIWNIKTSDQISIMSMWSLANKFDSRDFSTLTKQLLTYIFISSLKSQ